MGQWKQEKKKGKERKEEDERQRKVARWSLQLGMKKTKKKNRKFGCSDLSLLVVPQLREEGVVDKLKKKWWDRRSECTDSTVKASSTPMSISLDHMAGVFIVLAGGIVVSVMFLMVERRCNNLRREVNKSTVGAPVNDGVIVRLNSLTSHRTKHTLKPKQKKRS